MNVDTRKAVRPLHRLQKLLEDFPARPSPEAVHDLRTRVRHLEAVIHMFSPDSDRDTRRLLKLIKPVRKAAGKVRDMDVFIAKLQEVQVDSAAEDLALLTEHIASRRDKYLARLHQAIERNGNKVRRSIRQYGHLLEAGDGITSAAIPQILAAELDNWPRLHAGNLHEFRICAKELRYMLQLVPGADPQHVEALGEVKDLAGEWHDWLELQALAREVLDSAAGERILRQIAATTREKLHLGLAVANRMRKATMEVPQAA